MPGSSSHPHQPNAASHPPQSPRSHRPQQPPKQPSKAPLPTWQRRSAMIGATVATAVVLACCVGVGVAVNNAVQTSDAAATAAAATPTPQGKQVLTASGTGNQTTDSFTVDTQWYLHWACQTTAPNVAGKLAIAIRTSKDTSLPESLPETACPPGKTSGVVTVPLYGPSDGINGYTLDVTSTGVSWTVTVTE